jgi:hypothetical protein
MTMVASQSIDETNMPVMNSSRDTNSAPKRQVVLGESMAHTNMARTVVIHTWA